MSVLYSVADGVATITLNRPESRNALNLESWYSFAQTAPRSVRARTPK